MKNRYARVKAKTDIGKAHQNQIKEGTVGLLIEYNPAKSHFVVVFEKRGRMRFDMSEMLFNSLFNIEWGNDNSIFAYYINLDNNTFTLNGGTINVNEETETMDEAIDLVKTNQSMKFDFEIPSNLTDDQKDYLIDLAKKDIGKFFKEIERLDNLS